MTKLKTILYEYKYRNEIDALVKEFFRKFDPKKKWTWKGKIGPFVGDSDEFDEYVIVKLQVEVVPVKDLEWSFNIEAAAEPYKDGVDLITGKIEINPTQFATEKDKPSAHQDLESEIRDMLRHELEHVEQNNFDAASVRYVSRDSNDPRYYVGYLLQGNEIPAYLRGFETVVEHTGKTLEQVMDAWYNNNKKNFKKDSYWKIVKGIWLKNAKRMKIKGI